MIKGIQKIKGLGVFENFNGDHGASEFGVKNLIYGWNYSGKTTLSRIFALLESKKPNPELPNFSFTLNSDKGPITEANFQTASQVVRVFNSDFISRNLNFSGSPFDPILLLGSESDEAQKELLRCSGMLERAHASIDKAQSDLNDMDTALSKAKTSSAASTKATLSLVKAYTATHLDNDLNAVRARGLNFELTSSAYEADLKLARTSDQDRPLTVASITLIPRLDELHSKAAPLLLKTPDLANTIDHLVKNPPIESWVESGLELHKDGDPCEFCGGALSDHRLAELRSHFSKDLGLHKQAIQSLLAQVESAQLQTPSQKDVELNAQFRSRFNDAKGKLTKAVEVHNQSIESLAESIRQKQKDAFTPVELTPLDASISASVKSALTDLNKVVTENNVLANNFDSAKAQAIDRLRLHLAQDFFKVFDVLKHESRIARLERRKKIFWKCVNVLNGEVNRLNALISRAQKGREEINARIESLLGSESVQISVIDVSGQERFQLIRPGGGVAKHLSDGEKTAIAFSFFITKLQELKDFGDAIVYIDDPISSLDSNHIFQVTSMIKETFFFQEGENGPWKTRCKQAFFSTHNFEFFHLLRELSPKSTKQGARLYLVKRIAPTASTLTDMPESMQRYSSEYQFLYESLHTFHQAPDKANFSVLMHLPNVVRRFVELYTLTQYPDDRMSVDQRAEKIFGSEKSKRILKVLHFFSHANNIEKISKNNELIFDLEYAVKDLIECISNRNPLHFEALQSAASNPAGGPAPE